jgi:hypothetical protein
MKIIKLIRYATYAKGLTLSENFLDIQGIIALNQISYDEQSHCKRNRNPPHNFIPIKYLLSIQYPEREQVE